MAARRRVPSTDQFSFDSGGQASGGYATRRTGTEQGMQDPTPDAFDPTMAVSGPSIDNALGIGMIPGQDNGSFWNPKPGFHYIDPREKDPDAKPYTGPSKQELFDRGDEGKNGVPVGGNWDTGGYARPGFTSSNFNQQAPSGYDPAKWGNPDHQTPKYVVSRILSGYNLGDPQQLQAAVRDIQSAYPGTTWDGRDHLSIPGVENDVDFITDFGGANGLAWQPAGGQSAGGPSPTALRSFANIQGVGAQGASGMPAANNGPDPFASLGGGTFVPGVGWYPTANLTPEMQAAVAASGQSAGGPAAPGATAAPAVSPTSRQGIDQILASILSPDGPGSFNQKRADSRVESARESLEGARKSETDSIMAMLAERGTYSPSGGPSTTALSGLEGDLNRTLATTVRDIYSDEGQSADERTIRALEMAGALSSDDADRLLDQFRAETDRNVGMGQLDLGRERNAIDRTLGEGNLALGRDRLGLEGALGFGGLDLDRLRANMQNNQFFGDLGLRQDQFGADTQFRSSDQLLEALRILSSLFPGLNTGFRDDG